MLTLIKRSSPVCPACNAMKAALDGEEIPHETIDITHEPEAIEKYGLTGVPVLLFEDSESGDTLRLDGAQPIEYVKRIMEGE